MSAGAQHGSPAATPGPGAPITQVMSKTPYAHSRWGLLTQDLASKQYLTSLNASQFFIPGSNAKLFSTSTLWSTLGPDYRFKTPVFRTGATKNGTLAGNLVLVASGDLTMGGRTKPTARSTSPTSTTTTPTRCPDSPP